MPNTLAHFAVQGFATRAVARDVAPGWILLGGVIPDVPWIFQRVNGLLGLGIDPYGLRIYAIAQSSLGVSLLLCAALALLARASVRVFAVLAAGAVLHLVLDAAEEKWANGALFFAPVSWELTNFGWFWPESPVAHALTLAGLGYLGWEWARRDRYSLGLTRPSAARLAGALLLTTAYLLVPHAMREGVIRSDSHFVATLRPGEPRVGRPVEFDRVGVGHGASGTSFRTLAGEEVEIVAGSPPGGGVLSLRASFVAPRAVEVHEYHAHQGRLRDLGSYVGLLLLPAFWLPLGRVRD